MPTGQDLRQKCYDVMTRPEGRDAFNLDREPAKVRDRYGRHPLGKTSCWPGGMVEAGVRFVTVNGWTGQAPHDTAGPPSSSWDMHGGNMGMGDAFGNGSYGMGFCLPRLDQALAALLSDLKERGMMDNTLVVVTGRVRPHTQRTYPATARTPALAQLFLGHLGRRRDRQRQNLWQVRPARRVRHQQPRSPRGIGSNDLPRARYSAQRAAKQ